MHREWYEGMLAGFEMVKASRQPFAPVDGKIELKFVASACRRIWS